MFLLFVIFLEIWFLWEIIFGVYANYYGSPWLYSYSLSSLYDIHNYVNEIYQLSMANSFFFIFMVLSHSISRQIVVNLFKSYQGITGHTLSQRRTKTRSVVHLILMHNAWSLSPRLYVPGYYFVGVCTWREIKGNSRLKSWSEKFMTATRGMHLLTW